MLRKSISYLSLAVLAIVLFITHHPWWRRRITWSVGRGAHVGGQHLDGGSGAALPGQTLLHLLQEPHRDVLQLVIIQTHGVQEPVHLGGGWRRVRGKMHICTFVQNGSRRTTQRPYKVFMDRAALWPCMIPGSSCYQLSQNCHTYMYILSKATNKVVKETAIYCRGT